MPEMDWVVTGQNAQWLVQRRTTGRENLEIALALPRGSS